MADTTQTREARGTIVSLTTTPFVTDVWLSGSATDVRPHSSHFVLHKADENYQPRFEMLLAAHVNKMPVHFYTKDYIDPEKVADILHVNIHHEA